MFRTPLSFSNWEQNSSGVCGASPRILGILLPDAELVFLRSEGRKKVSLISFLPKFKLLLRHLVLLLTCGYEVCGFGDQGPTFPWAGPASGLESGCPSPRGET